MKISKAANLSVWVQSAVSPMAFISSAGKVRVDWDRVQEEADKEHDRFNQFSWALAKLMIAIRLGDYESFPKEDAP